MASSTTSTARCAICSRANASFCKNCRSAAYCGPTCQHTDWPLHKTLCSTFANLPARPSPTHKLGFLFPENSNAAEIAWVDRHCSHSDLNKCAKRTERYHSNPNSPEFDPDTGEPKPGCVGCCDESATAIASAIAILKAERVETSLRRCNKYRRFNLGCVIRVDYRAEFLSDGSGLNRSVSRLTNGVNRCWKGPVLITRMREPHDSNDDEVYYEDMNLSDLRRGLDVLCSFDGESMKLGGMLVKGVQINCAGDHKFLTSPELQAMEIPRDSKRIKDARPFHLSVTDQLDLSLLVIKTTQHISRKNAVDDGKNGLKENRTLKALHLNSVPSSDSFGQYLARGVSFIETAMVIRRDLLDLDKHHVEALAGFVHGVAEPLVVKLISSSDGPDSKETLIKSTINKNALSQFFEDLRLRKVNERDLVWRKTPDPYNPRDIFLRDSGKEYNTMMPMLQALNMHPLTSRFRMTTMCGFESYQKYEAVEGEENGDD